MFRNRIPCIPLIGLTFVINLLLNSTVGAQECKDCGDRGQVPTITGNYTEPPLWRCPPKEEFEYDDVQSAVTIAPGGSTTIYVIGGNPPFTWGNPGPGYSWGTDSPTNSRSNQLVCSGGT